MLFFEKKIIIVFILSLSFWIAYGCGNKDFGYAKDLAENSNTSILISYFFQRRHCAVNSTMSE